MKRSCHSGHPSRMLRSHTHWFIQGDLVKKSPSAGRERASVADATCVHHGRGARAIDPARAGA